MKAKFYRLMRLIFIKYQVRLLHLICGQSIDQVIGRNRAAHLQAVKAGLFPLAITI